MKRVLIIGRNSYIGRSLENWLANYPQNYSVDLISLREDSWRKEDFSPYDVVFYAAGIAHRRETKENADLYYKVNSDLTHEVAKKAKHAGVRQFIFLSSMSVYGIEKGVITQSTSLKPRSNYGKSKLKGENLIQSLMDSYFKIAILRPPMVYGKGCKGNYKKLANLAVKSPIFPYIQNKRSMIYIDNLCQFIKLLIDDCSSGVFFPQNKEYVCTSDMVRMIAEAHGKKIRMTKVFNILLGSLENNTLNKVFGDLVYDMSLSKYENYKPVPVKESIKLTET